MITKKIYRYKKDSSVIDSVTQPSGDYTLRYRLIADENKLLTKDGELIYSMIDINIEDLSLWYEIDKPENQFDNNS